MKPDSSKCEPYLRYSALKLKVATFHLEQFETALGELSIADWDFKDPPSSRLLAVYAHADACVFQLVGAFDAWACAAAWALGHKGPDDASFAKLIGGPPLTIRSQIEAVGSDSTWAHLVEQRHLAAHRGVVATKRVLSPQLSNTLIIRTGNGDEALPLLRDLASWANIQLEKLFQYGRDSGWYLDGNSQDVRQ